MWIYSFWLFDIEITILRYVCVMIRLARATFNRPAKNCQSSRKYGVHSKAFFIMSPVDCFDVVSTSLVLVVNYLVMVSFNVFYYS